MDSAGAAPSSAFLRPKRNKRRPVKKKDYVLPPADLESDEDVPKKRKKAVRPYVERCDMQEGEHVMEKANEKELEEQIPFCCAGECYCMKHHPTEYNELGDRLYLEPEAGSGWLDHLSHRRCCHGLYKWASESDAAYNARVNGWIPTLFKLFNEEQTEMAFALTAEASPPPSVPESPLPTYFTGVEIEAAHNAWGMRASQIANDDQLPTEDTRLSTSKQYADLCKSFEERSFAMFGKKDKPKAVVLDMFGGIGAASVVLKKLEIGISKIIFIELDKVAIHVFRHNHDRGYNENLEDDGIEYVINPPELNWAKFAGLDDEGRHEMLKGFLKEHGREGNIDIIIGGPPCGSHSKVNAHRKGVNSIEGSYLPCFGKMIRMVEGIQTDPLIFLAENVVLSGDDLDTVNESFGFPYDPYRLNAHYLSPAMRDRMYWTNVPLDKKGLEYTGKLANVSQETCLDNDMVGPSTVLEGDNAFSKSNCFMASYSRLDAPLCMHVVVNKLKPPRGRYYGRPYTGEERERLMGLPPDYVVAPDGLSVMVLTPEKGDGGVPSEFLAKTKRGWRDRLDKKYHCFCGNYGGFRFKGDFHQFETSDKLKLAPPPSANEEARKWLSLNTKEDMSDEGEADANSEPSKPTFLDAELYAKHLIGNSFSIPVLEHLLQPVAGLFETGCYERFDYSYAWQAD